MPLTSTGHKYFQKGYDAIGAGNPAEAVKSLKLAAINFKRDYNNQMLVKAMNLIAIADGIADDDDDMALAITDGLKYCDMFGFRGAKNLFYNALCDRYLKLNDFENGLKYALMTVENLEKYGTEFDNPPAAYMVAYLNTAFAYLKTGDSQNAEINLNKAIETAHSNDIHKHDYTFNTMLCCIKHLAGDDGYVKKHTTEILSVTSNSEITITDYIQDIELAVDLLVDMKDFKSAIKLVDALNETLDENSTLHLKLSISKLFMKIYKENGDKDKYYKACDMYIADDMAIKEQDALGKLKVLSGI